MDAKDYLLPSSGARGDGLYNMTAFNAIKLYTYNWLKWYILYVLP